MTCEAPSFRFVEPTTLVAARADHRADRRADRRAGRLRRAERIDAVETLGCAIVFCSGKTGTLTTGEVTVQDFAVAADEGIAPGARTCRRRPHPAVRSPCGRKRTVRAPRPSASRGRGEAASALELRAMRARRSLGSSPRPVSPGPSSLPRIRREGWKDEDILDSACERSTCERSAWERSAWHL